MEADNEIPESHPESSSAFGWSFCLSVVLSAICNLLPESYAGYQEAADASYLNVPLYAVSSVVSVWRDHFTAEDEVSGVLHKLQATRRQRRARMVSVKVKEEHPLPLAQPSHAPRQVSHSCYQYARVNPSEALAHRFFLWKYTFPKAFEFLNCSETVSQFCQHICCSHHL